MLNLFQDLSAEKDKIRLAARCWNKLTLFNLLTLGIAQASLALLSLNRKFQDDYWRYLLFLHSFWCSQFNTYVKSHHSLLTTQKSVASACHCPHLSKNKKREFWTEWRKCKNYQPSYSQANTKPWKTSRKHTKKDLSVSWVLLKSFRSNT